MFCCKRKSLDKSAKNPEEHQLTRNGTVRHVVSELHQTVIEGDLVKLRQLLATISSGTLMAKDDEKNRTPLHYAVNYWDIGKGFEMAAAIISKGKELEKSQKGLMKELINALDTQDETPLHLAIRAPHNQQAVELLLENGADLTLKAKYPKDPKTALDLVFENMPNVLFPYFEQSIKFDKMEKSGSGLNRLNTKFVQLDFETIIGPSNNWRNPDTSSIYRALKSPSSKYKDLLFHPFVQLFLHTKYQMLKCVFRVSISFHILWSIVTAWYFFYMYVYTCPYKASAVIKGSTNDTLMDVVPCDIGGSWLRVNKVVVMLFSCLMLLKELCELLTAARMHKYAKSRHVSTLKRTRASLKSVWKNYLRKLENLGQLTLIAIILFATVPIFLSKSYPQVNVHHWHYPVAAFGILIPWGLLLGQVGKSHIFGVYIEIYKRVCQSFVVFTFAFISILIAFALSFTILMPEYGAFNSAPSALVKVLVMMTGEYEYEEMFSDEKNGGRLGFPFMAHLIFVAFVATVTITLFNLLIGLNVTDIQGLREGAEISELAATLERIHLMEEFLIICNKLFHCFPCFHLQPRFSLQRHSRVLNGTVNTEQHKKVVLSFKKDIIRKMTSLEKCKRQELVNEVTRLAYRNKAE